MAENQATHRQEIEQKIIFIEGRNSLLGIISALLIGLATIAGGVFVAIKASPVAGTFLSGIGLASLIWAFIYGTRVSRKDTND